MYFFYLHLFINRFYFLGVHFCQISRDNIIPPDYIYLSKPHKLSYITCFLLFPHYIFLIIAI